MYLQGRREQNDCKPAARTQQEGGEKMAVESRHVNASLRLMNAERGTIQTLTRIRPSIEALQVIHIAEALQHIRGAAPANAALTVVNELVRA